MKRTENSAGHSFGEHVMSAAKMMAAVCKLRGWLMCKAEKPEERG